MVRPAREQLEGGKLKGGIFRSHLRWLAETRSSEEQAAFWERISPEARSALSGMILVSNWFPFAWMVEIDRTLMEMFGNGRYEFLQDLGRWSARINLSTTYKAFDRQTNHQFFRNSALLHSQFQDFGSAEYEETGEKSGRIIHRDYPCYSRIFCASAPGYYEGCITSHGASRAWVTEAECQCFGDPTCTYELKWM
jgi:hypothetical protein